MYHKDITGHTNDLSSRQTKHDDSVDPRLLKLRALVEERSACHSVLSYQGQYVFTLVELCSEVLGFRGISDSLSPFLVTAGLVTAGTSDEGVPMYVIKAMAKEHNTLINQAKLISDGGEACMEAADHYGLEEEKLIEHFMHVLEANPLMSLIVPVGDECVSSLQLQQQTEDDATAIYNMLELNTDQDWDEYTGSLVKDRLEIREEMGWTTDRTKAAVTALLRRDVVFCYTVEMNVPSATGDSVVAPVQHLIHKDAADLHNQLVQDMEDLLPKQLGGFTALPAHFPSRHKFHKFGFRDV